MPELPELEVVREVLQRRLVGQTITEVQILPPGGPIVVRDLSHAGFEAALTGARLSAVNRRGKFLICSFDTGVGPLFLAVNPKLTGRLQLAAAGEKRLAKTHVVFTFASGQQLRYLDQKRMGQIYLTRDLQSVPDYAGLGPEPFDVSLDAFRARLKPFRGEIKGVLTRGEFVAGIGNAYADEILWAARLHPYRKRTQLTTDEVDRLYAAMRLTLTEAIDKVRLEIQENIHLKPRDFLAVHMKTGEPCPRCGTPISLVGANQRITNFCRSCQPGGLIKGMS
jgi:formamidopyrimidine-DNA glycosylase